MQPYGINLAGDLMGTLLIAVLFLLFGGRRTRGGWIVLAACAVASLIGSASVLAHAAARTEPWWPATTRCGSSSASPSSTSPGDNSAPSPTNRTPLRQQDVRSNLRASPLDERQPTRAARTLQGPGACRSDARVRPPA